MTTTEWIGGKYAGCINEQKLWCQVLFTKSTGLKSKCFSYNKYDSKNKAFEHAREYQRKISNENNLTKNKYRYVTDTKGYRYVEVKLQNDLIMKCEPEHIDIVQERIWSGNKSKDKYTYYVKSRESKKRKQDHILFHNRAYPNLTQVDHINRDGLDNRKNNIREGGNRINPNNKRMQKNNTSGIKGVYKTTGNKSSWCAQWVDTNGVKRKRSFGIKTYGEKIAFQYACDARQQQQGKTMDFVKGYKRLVQSDGSVIMEPLNPAKLIFE